MDPIQKRLEELGLTLPDIGQSAGDYVHARQIGDVVYLAGKGPLLADGTLPSGRVGAEFTLDEGYEFARLSGLSLIAALSQALDGQLDRVTGFGKVLGFVRGSDDFTAHPKVIDGCSELFTTIFGARGQHARSAVGVHTLPFGIPVEIEASVHVK